MKFIFSQKRKTLLLLIGILALGIAFRSVLLVQHGFYEPDVYYYYSVMQQTLQNRMIIPNPIPLSGFPVHEPYWEKPGMIYLTLLPFVFLRQIIGNLSLYDFLRVIPIAWGLAEVIAAYILTYDFTKSRNAALLGALIAAVLPATVIRTEATAYRGETFVPALLAFTLILLIRYRRPKAIGAMKFIAMNVSIALLLLAIFYIWNGSLYVYAVIGVFIGSAMLYSLTRKPWKAILILSATVIGLWILGWILLSFIFPGYNSFLVSHSNLLKTIFETQPPNLTSLALLLGVALVFAPLGIFIYAKDSRKRKATDYAYLALFANFIITALMLTIWVRWAFLLGLPASIFCAYGIWNVYTLLSKRNNQTLRAAFLSAAISVLFILSASVVLTQTTYWNQQLANTFSWIASNTPQNSTILPSTWMDGSLIEGLSDRTAYTQSVNITGAKAYSISRFLLANAYNFSFLAEIKPDYLLLERSSINDPKSIEKEGAFGNVTLNATNLYLLLESANSTISSGSVTLYRVYSNNDTIIYKVFQSE